jgi:hypothetical protein
LIRSNIALFPKKAAGGIVTPDRVRTICCLTKVHDIISGLGMALIVDLFRRVKKMIMPSSSSKKLAATLQG